MKAMMIWSWSCFLQCINMSELTVCILTYLEFAHAS
jgi:hypothetical protein